VAGVPAWFDELAEFLRIQSISADPARAADVVQAGEWVCGLIRGAGGACELIDWHGAPLAVGEVRASRDPDHAPTVLCYGHFDVQPADPLELWESPPFEPEIRGEYLYGRGVADDKGQLYLLLSAARELARSGELPVNVRFACDGEEESGGHAIVDFIAADERGADAAVIFDSGMVARDRPAFDVATRGIAYFHVTLRSGERDLHSGLYGGAALNAAHALMWTLGSVVAVDGRLAEPLRQGVAPPTEAELASWRELPPGVGELAEQGAQPADPQAAEEFYLRTFAEPALDVNGLDSGSPHIQKTVLPVQADANVSIRLAPGQAVEPVVEAFKRMLREAAPAGAELDIELLAAAPPAIMPPDAKPIRLGVAAFERALGVRPLLIRSGGSLPIAAAFADKGIATVITGFSLPNANLHSPNERLLAEYIPRGIATARALFEEFAAL
jgi:acetylornithine deacetylase/succinyl-diaminopimelate desuccinylase-like protein